MATSTESDENNTILSDLFKEGLNLYNEIGNSNEPSNSSDFQQNVKRAMRTFEKCTELVSLAGMFSTNEEVEEIPTNNIQYLLLPALLGSLSLRLTTGERKDIIDVAEIYFKDYLKRCNEYHLTNYEFKVKRDNGSTSNRTELEQLEVEVNTRANKIERFKQHKELKNKLQDLKKNMDNEYVDEEIKRDYYLTMIKLFIHDAIDELRSIDMEKPILEHMMKIKSEHKKEPKGPVPKPLKPIIITRDEVQKAVFGAGYPSLPTMTVKEFYDKKVAEGDFPDPNKQSKIMSLQQASLAGVDLNDQKEEEDIAKENAVEEDDEEYIERMRRMDDFKDDHRRGWGNRMNRS